MIARGSRRQTGFLFEGTVVLSVVLAACLCSGQGLGDVAEREKAKRDQAAREKGRREATVPEAAEPEAAAREQTKPDEALRDEAEDPPPAPSYGTDAVPPGEPAEPPVPGDDPAVADPASATSVTSPESEDLPTDLPWCEPGLEMLRAWSESHQELAEECRRADLPKSGRFDIEIVVSGAGRLEIARVNPKNDYTTCLAQRLRGRSMPTPVDGKRCRARYGSQWRN